MPEAIGVLVPTQLPTLSDVADIQEAFRLYHYGAESGTNVGEYDPSNANVANLVTQSIASYINTLNVKVAAIEAAPSVQRSQYNAKGALVTATANSVLSTLAVGTDGSVLVANSQAANGITWAPASVTPENTATFTNKTINLQVNTLTGTTTQFNAALSDNDFATIAGTETLTNKTLTSPTINSPTISGLYIGDTTGITFEGSSADAFETTLNVIDPTADRVVNLPNVDGTVITTGNLSSITSTGTLTSLNVTGNAVYHLDFQAITASITAPTLWDGQFIEVNSASEVNITLPNTASASFPRGSQFTVFRKGAGGVQFLQDSGVSILSSPGRKLRAQNSSCTVIKLTDPTQSTQEWAIVGDLIA